MLPASCKHIRQESVAHGTPPSPCSSPQPHAPSSMHRRVCLWGCVKLGDSRVLKLHQPAQCTFEAALLCVANPATRYGRAQERHTAGGGRGRAGTAAEGGLSSELTAHIEAGLHGGHITTISMHNRLGTTHPSIYAQPTSTTCAQRQHASNRAVVEIDCWADRGAYCAEMGAGQAHGKQY